MGSSPSWGECCGVHPSARVVQPRLPAGSCIPPMDRIIAIQHIDALYRASCPRLLEAMHCRRYQCALLHKHHSKARMTTLVVDRSSASLRAWSSAALWDVWPLFSAIASFPLSSSYRFAAPQRRSSGQKRPSHGSWPGGAVVPVSSGCCGSCTRSRAWHTS